MAGGSLLAKLLNFLRYVVATIQGWFRPSTKITLDTGITVRMGRQLAEGGFSFVFLATDPQQPSKVYALKRIRCPDAETLQGCRREAGIHRSVHHPNLLALQGLAVLPDGNDSLCFMLFEYLPQSLRSVINQRFFTNDTTSSSAATPVPWPELQVLHYIHGAARGLSALHALQIGHADVKPENILLRTQPLLNTNSSNSWPTPVLMDFGSAVSPLETPLGSRRDVLNVLDRAATHTTMPYRPPELFDNGMLRLTGKQDSQDEPDTLNYAAVDVWSLGATLFAVLYGAPPAETEFRQNGTIRITECTQLGVLKDVPHPRGTPWYNTELHELVGKIMVPDRHQRPSLSQVMEWMESLIKQKGGRVEGLVHPFEMDSAPLSGGSLMNSV